MTFARAILLTLLAGGLASALAAGGPSGHSHGPAASTLGAPAAKGAGRTVAIDMTDNAFSQKTLTVKSGETVRFVLANKGSLLHEFNLNTRADHIAHRPMMAEMMDHGMITPEKVISLTMKMPDGTTMSHIEPHSVLLEPGRKAELSWTFGAPGELEIACNIPGHAESGMVIPVHVVAR